MAYNAQGFEQNKCSRQSGEVRQATKCPQNLSMDDIKSLSTGTLTKKVKTKNGTDKDITFVPGDQQHILQNVLPGKVSLTKKVGEAHLDTEKKEHGVYWCRYNFRTAVRGKERCFSMKYVPEQLPLPDTSTIREAAAKVKLQLINSLAMAQPELEMYLKEKVDQNTNLSEKPGTEINSLPGALDTLSNLCKKVVDRAETAKITFNKDPNGTPKQKKYALKVTNQFQDVHLKIANQVTEVKNKLHSYNSKGALLKDVAEGILLPLRTCIEGGEAGVYTLNTWSKTRYTPLTK